MTHIARNETMETWGFLKPGYYLIQDRDGKYCSAFQDIPDASGINRVPLPPAIAKFERLRGALGEIGEIRGRLEAHFVRRTVTSTRLDSIHSAFSRRAASPGILTLADGDR